MLAALSSDDKSARASSPLIAAILLVGVTVVVSGVVATYAINYTENTGNTTNPNSGVEVIPLQTGDNLTLTLSSGEPDKLTVYINGTKVKTVSDPAVGDDITVNVSNGDRITVVSATNNHRRVVATTDGDSYRTVKGPTDGLVAYWTMDRQDTIKDTLLDSANTYNAEVSNSTKGKDGVVKQAYGFPGAGTSLDLNKHIENGSTSDGFTLSVWVKPNAVTTQRRMFDEDNGLGDRSFMTEIGLTGSTVGFSVYDTSDVGHLIETGPIISAGVWYNIVFVWNSSGHAIWVNGTKEASGLGSSMQSSSVDMSFGRRQSNGDLLFNGTADEARVYDHALNKSEIQELYNSTKGGI